MPIPFWKMHGAANDFVVIDHRERRLPEGAARRETVARLCDRRRGVGADGVLLIEPDPELDFAMSYFNSDGGAADYCGNGARCVARLALDLGLGHAGTVRFRSAAGVQDAHRRDDGLVEVHFGVVDRPAGPVSLTVGGRAFEGRVIQAGVPHFVTAVERVADVPLAHWAPGLRSHPGLGPEGANVDFVSSVDGPAIAMRTWERGVEGETLACGSGAIASALWAAAGGHESPVRVITAGGDELEVSFETMADGWDVSLAGPAEIAFTGCWNPGAAGEEPSCSKD